MTFTVTTTIATNDNVDTWLPGNSRTVPDMPTYLANNAVFNVKDYGAKCDGSTDDTGAFTAAMAALPAAGGLILVPGKSVTSSPIATPNKRVGIIGYGPDVSGIINAASNLFTLGSHTFPDNFVVRGMLLQSNTGGGHIFNAGTQTIAGMILSDCLFQQNNATKSVWYQTGTGEYIDNEVNQCWSVAATSASTPLWNLAINGGLVNSNTWRRSRFTGGNGTAYMVVIGNADGASYQTDNVFRDLTFELPSAGCVQVVGCHNTLFEECNLYDFTATTTADLFSVKTTGSLGGLGTAFRNCVRRGGILGNSLYDINVDAVLGRANITLIQCTNAGGSTYNVNLGGNTAFLNVPGVTLTNVGYAMLFDGNRTWLGKPGATGAAGILQHLSTTAIWDPGTVANGAVAATTINLSGVSPGDTCVVGDNNLGSNNVILHAFVQSSGVIRVLLHNLTGGNYTPGSGTVRVDVWQH